MQTTPDDIFDAIILGGGPAGAAAAIRLRQLGRSVVVFEKDAYPRFHIGESLIPQIMAAFEKLGLLDRVKRVPQARKTGVEFALGNNARGNRIAFVDSLTPAHTRRGGARRDVTFNFERAPFDQMILGVAADAGAQVHQCWKVQSVDHLADDDVRVTAVDLADDDATPRAFRGRCVIDASGQSTLLGRHLKTRRNFDAPHFQKIAYFEHFEGVNRDNALGEDCISMVMCDEGWFWMIPLDDRRVSIGMVLDAAVARQVKLPANQMLAWGVERCPLIFDRVRNAKWPEKNYSISDYSYSCAPYAGPGYYLVGDAATFLDPVFSTGLFLSMQGAMRAAESLDDALAGRVSHPRARRRYIRFLRPGVTRFFKLIRTFYDPAFRDLFLSGVGPLGMHRALIAVFAGQVFPKPAWRVRWRLKLFYGCVWLQRRVALSPRRAGFSLLKQQPDVRPQPAEAAPSESRRVSEPAHALAPGA